MARFSLWGIPETVEEKVRAFGRGTLLDVLWKLLVIGVLGVVSLLLIAAGPYGAALGGVLLGTLLSEEVRKMVADIWNRRWAEVTI